MQVSSRNINQWINYFSLSLFSLRLCEARAQWGLTNTNNVNWTEPGIQDRLETEITNQFMRSESHCPAPPAVLAVTSKSDAFNHLLGGIKTIIATPRFSALELCSPQVKWQNVRKTRRNQRVREYRETFWFVLSWVRMFSQWCNS